MKKTFLFFFLAILIGVSINIPENDGQTVTALTGSSITASGTDDDTDLADSFLTAFGMDDKDSNGSVSTGLSTISTISTNQVTPPFTPHQK
ncbi:MULTISPECIES: hypothetical protein [Psychrilyobacter]|uniref:Secreted protein n=1 Tax=Psychrilyobacter piezotolerans TaxID=2293438 RepID=A0ABX9KKI7_9FUSO|nr:MULTISPECIES: hypothetical protein [Psychrilyobacter]MCS5423181.1 hypothetical protein [Psychrilyobacter sp. S5]NDI76299.1 hypothetical protein [Psychrilyobacter piezotolerans]RDE65898.1 hypothetical protein DV867_00040 [Psychrilyobacter sp. S5]REI43076.1 hypothetical protein DYH56_00040 [Psychrilyobacter piezotolerans]